MQFKAMQFQTYKIKKKKKKLEALTIFEMHVKFFLAGMRAQ
jgi:hypothetical protein